MTIRCFFVVDQVGLDDGWVFWISWLKDRLFLAVYLRNYYRLDESEMDRVHKEAVDSEFGGW